MCHRKNIQKHKQHKATDTGRLSAENIFWKRKPSLLDRRAGSARDSGKNLSADRKLTNKWHRRSMRARSPQKDFQLR